MAKTWPALVCSTMLVRSPGAAATALIWMPLIGTCWLPLSCMDGPSIELDWACSAVRNVTVTGSPPLLINEPDA